MVKTEEQEQRDEKEWMKRGPRQRRGQRKEIRQRERSGPRMRGGQRGEMVGMTSHPRIAHGQRYPMPC